MGSAVKAVTKPFKKVFKETERFAKSGGIGVDLLKDTLSPDINIDTPGTDPRLLEQQQLQTNLSRDLGLENLPDVQVGGAAISQDSTRKRRAGRGGVSSSLGIS